LRGDAGLHARLLLRGTGLAGVTVAVGGGVALVGAYRPWHAVTVELAMLGDDQRRPIAELAGWEAHPWGWLVPALGIVAIVTGAALAIDRPPMHARPLLLGSAAGLAASAGLGLVRSPEVNRFDVAGSRLRELSQLADRLPQSVELSFSVGTAPGLWLTLVAATLIAAGTLGARELP
jgi:hypothetical protein